MTESSPGSHPSVSASSSPDGTRPSPDLGPGRRYEIERAVYSFELGREEEMRFWFEDMAEQLRRGWLHENGFEHSAVWRVRLVVEPFSWGEKSGAAHGTEQSGSPETGDTAHGLG